MDDNPDSSKTPTGSSGDTQSGGMSDPVVGEKRTREESDEDSMSVTHPVAEVPENPEKPEVPEVPPEVPEVPPEVPEKPEPVPVLMAVPMAVPMVVPVVWLLPPGELTAVPVCFATNTLQHFMAISQGISLKYKTLDPKVSKRVVNSLTDKIVCRTFCVEGQDDMEYKMQDAWKNGGVRIHEMKPVFSSTGQRQTQCHNLVLCIVVWMHFLLNRFAHLQASKRIPILQIEDPVVPDMLPTDEFFKVLVPLIRIVIHLCTKTSFLALRHEAPVETLVLTVFPELENGMKMLSAEFLKVFQTRIHNLTGQTTETCRGVFMAAFALLRFFNPKIRAILPAFSSGNLKLWLQLSPDDFETNEDCLSDSDDEEEDDEEEDDDESEEDGDEEDGDEEDEDAGGTTSADVNNTAGGGVDGVAGPTVAAANDTDNSTTQLDEGVDNTTGVGVDGAAGLTQAEWEKFEKYVETVVPGITTDTVQCDVPAAMGNCMDFLLSNMTRDNAASMFALAQSTMTHCFFEQFQQLTRNEYDGNIANMKNEMALMSNQLKISKKRCNVLQRQVKREGKKPKVQHQVKREDKKPKVVLASSDDDE